MSPENGSPKSGSSPPARTLLVEWLVVGSVLLSLAATFVAVAAFLAGGSKRLTLPEPAAKPALASTAAPGPAPEPPRPKVAAKPPEPAAPQPDTSIDKARELQGRIAAARERKAKRDLLTWSARKAADWLNSRAKTAEATAGAALAQGEKAAADAARIRGQASDLADAIARLELKRDDAKSRLEAARTRKGYSILPYRGPNGAWQRPLPIECSRDIAQIMPGGPTFRLIDLELSGLTANSLFARIVELAMRKAAAQATPDGNAPTVYVLFVVRPSGIKAYYEARARLQAQGVAFGYELVGENTSIEYPDLGDLSEWPGYVPSDEIVDAITARPPIAATDPATSSGSPGFGGSATGGSLSGSGIGPGTGAGTEEDGLFVWKNGLDGARPTPGMRRNPGGSASGSANQPGVPGGLGDPGAGGEPGTAPRVDFGSGGGNGATGRPGGIGRGPGFPGLKESGQPGGVSTNPGTFEDLVAELAARGEMGTPKSMTRPGAVAILPGDLEDDAEGSQESGLRGGSPMPRGNGRGYGASQPGGGSAAPGLPNSPSPFGTQPPTLPRFEPAPGSNDFQPGLGATGTGANGSDSAAQPRTTGNGISASPLANADQLQPDSTGQPGETPVTNGNPAGTPGERSAASGSNGNARSRSNPNSGTANSRNASEGEGAGQPSASTGSPGSARSSNSAESKGRGMSGSGDPSGEPSGEGPRLGLRNSVRRLFGGEERLPEKSWEVSLTCDADGITVRPGEHRLSLKDLQTDTDLLPRTLQSMFERHVRDYPERFWRPFVKYRLAAGGEPLMGLSQQQLAAGFVRWPAIVEPVATAGKEGPR